MSQLHASHPLPISSNTHGAFSHLASDPAVASAAKRPGLPPTPPQSFSHSRSSSQPPFFSLDSLPPFAQAVAAPNASLLDSADVSMDVPDSTNCHPAAPLAKPSSGLPPRKAHRRSRSDIPFGYFQPSPSFPPAPPPAGDAQAVKLEPAWGLSFDARNGDGISARKPEGEPAGDDFFNAYLNLEGLDGLNSSEDKHDDLDSRGSSMKTNSSENESEGSAIDCGAGSGMQLWTGLSPMVTMERREGVKRNAMGDPTSATSKARHFRSLSMDSLMGKLDFAAMPPNLLPAPGQQHAQALQSNGSNGNKFSLEFGTGEFSPAEMKKIMADEKLTEMAMADPKRVKRVLANRQSAARSKERKMRYIVELEKKVQILQTEATTLSAQLTLLQRDSAGLVSQNNELKFRLQAMEQQGQLRDALNEALTAEVQRLKLAATELGDSCSSNNLTHQMQLNQIPFYQLQQPRQNGSAVNNES